MPSPRREALNRKMALLSGWKETDEGNWCSLSGEVFALPPDYCKKSRHWVTAIAFLSDAEREATVKFLVSLKEK